MTYINEVLHLLISNTFFQRRILLKYYLFQNKLTESVRMHPEWSSGFEVKLEKSETPSTESRDAVKLEQDDNEITVEGIKNNFENQGMQFILVDE